MVITTEEKVKVKLEAFVEGFKQKFAAVKKSVRGLNTVLDLNNKQYIKIRTSSGGVDKRMKGLNNTGARLGNKIRFATAGLKGFKMEMLGVMFFGMAMQRMFKSMLRPALELTGVFEIWRTTLQLLFLPMALLIFSFLMPLFTWLINLSDETKLFIGKLVLFGLAIGTVLLIIGTLALGIGSMIVAFGSFLTIIDRLLPDITILGVNLSSIVEGALGIGIAVVAWKALKVVIGGILDKLIQTNIIKEFFDRMDLSLDTSLTAWENFKVLFKGIIDKIKSKLNIDVETEEMGFNIGQIIKDVKNMKTKIKGFLTEIGFDDLRQDFSDMLAAFKDSQTDITSLADSLETIADVLKRIIKSVTTLKTFFGKPGESVNEGTFGALGSGIRNPLREGVGLQPTNVVSRQQQIINNIVNQTFNGPTSEDILRLIRGEADSLVVRLGRNV